jgi:hypothetical protein
MDPCNRERRTRPLTLGAVPFATVAGQQKAFVRQQMSTRSTKAHEVGNIRWKWFEMGSHILSPSPQKTKTKPKQSWDL